MVLSGRLPNTSQQVIRASFKPGRAEGRIDSKHADLTSPHSIP